MNLFKKITNAFSGGRHASAESPTAKPAEPNQATLTVFDKFGRQLLISKETYRKDLLPKSLLDQYDNPDRLYGTIVVSLKDGFFAEVKDATRRLLEIDTDQERSSVVRAIVLMKTGDLPGARKVLAAYVERHGPTGVILNNLAKVYFEQGDLPKAEETLWQGLTLDPNQDNGLSWWGAIHNERAGREGFLSAMRKAAAIQGSYRPQLWLARAHLDDKDLTRAMELYRQILIAHAESPDALMMISGDLGQHGYVNEMLELITPIYKADKQDPRAGFNLITAYLQRKDRTAAERLLHQLALLGRQDIKPQLSSFENQLVNLKNEKLSSEASFAVQAVEAATLDKPIWYYGLNEPTWLFPRPQPDGDGVLLVSLSNLSIGDVQRIHVEDDLGRLTRSIPLYLAESLLYDTTLPVSVAILTLKGSGPVVFGKEVDSDWVWQFVEHSAMAGVRFVVTGSVGQVEAGLSLVLCLWDRQDKILVARIERAAPTSATAVRLVEEELLAILRRVAHQAAVSVKSFLPARQTSQNLDHYLIALGQSLTMTLTVNNFMPKDGICGERNLLDSILALAAERPQPIPRIMFFSALAKCKAYGSEVYLEYKSQALALADEAREGSDLFWLTPLVYKLFEMDDLFVRRKDRLLKNADKEYRDWLDRL